MDPLGVAVGVALVVVVVDDVILGSAVTLERGYGPIIARRWSGASGRARDTNWRYFKSGLNLHGWNQRVVHVVFGNPDVFCVRKEISNLDGRAQNTPSMLCFGRLVWGLDS